jgi:hypothetical protein
MDCFLVYLPSMINFQHGAHLLSATQCNVLLCTCLQWWRLFLEHFLRHRYEWNVCWCIYFQCRDISTSSTSIVKSMNGVSKSAYSFSGDISTWQTSRSTTCFQCFMMQMTASMVTSQDGACQAQRQCCMYKTYRPLTHPKHEQQLDRFH